MPRISSVSDTTYIPLKLQIYKVKDQYILLDIGHFISEREVYWKFLTIDLPIASLRNVQVREFSFKTLPNTKPKSTLRIYKDNTFRAL